MISLIVAVSRNNVIGKDNSLPWTLPADLKHFRETTTGHAVIMGRKTFESIGRPLPKRRNIVITRQADYAPGGVEVMSSLEAALAATAKDEEAFVIGGGEIFRQALPQANRVYLTRIETDIEGDAFFPELDPGEWQEVSSRPGTVDEKNALPHTFLVFERKRA
jgi:dihydrofolate reductase